MNFFTSIYSWFYERSDKDLFGIMGNLEISESDGDVSLLCTNLFPIMGVTAAAISIIVAVAFYIWPINHPRFKSWWSWLIMLFSTAIINFWLAIAFIHHRISSLSDSGENLDNLNTIDGSPGIKLNDDNGYISYTFGEWCELAWSNLCVSVLFFILASLILTWLSTNARLSPFRK